MKAIILAAGRGSRLKPYTNTIPKTLIPFNRKTFLNYQIETLKKLGIDDIIIVTGFKSHKIYEACDGYEGITFFCNADYENSGALNSMSLARELFNDDLIILNSDIIYTEKCLKDVIDCQQNCVTVELGRYERGATTIKVDELRVLDMGFLEEKDSSGLSVGIIKIVKGYIFKVNEFLTDYPQQLHCYVFNLIKEFLRQEIPITYIKCPKGSWCEIDTIEDLNLYKSVIYNILGNK